MAFKEAKIGALEKEIAGGNIWQEDSQKAQKISQEIADLKRDIEIWKKFENDLTGIEKEVFGLKDFEEKGDEKDAESIAELKSEIEKGLKDFEKSFSKEELKVFFSGVHDKNNALLTIYSGAGGTEAQDWSAMLLRMYSRYAEKAGFGVKVLHIHEGQEAGIKNATIEIKGAYAYGYLKKESGVHRLVRVSPFNAQNLRHTSFALVEVLPEMEEAGAIVVRSEDLRVDTYRSSGPGGQNVNKLETAVRITHIPSGIVVACQSERSQNSNKEQAMKMLLSRIYNVELKKQQKEVQEMRADIQVGEGTAEWGSQIRNYVLHPYKLVKDLRTGIESKNPDEILDGNLEEFIEAELRM